MPSLRNIYQTLLAHFGSQHWWPGQTPLEVCIGAILTQNTNWQNVEKALNNLRAATEPEFRRVVAHPKKNLVELIRRTETDLEFSRLKAIPEKELAELILPSGYYNQKAKKLRLFLAWLDDTCGGNFSQLASRTTEWLRGELLALWGIGPETVDSILLYALHRPVFVVDAYTMRIALRHGWVEPGCSYDGLAAFFSEQLPAEVSLYNEFHALLVCLAKEYCRKREPLCDGCPLKN